MHRISLGFMLLLFISCGFAWYVDGLVQDCSNSTANALELLQSCAKPSIFTLYFQASFDGTMGAFAELIKWTRKIWMKLACIKPKQNTRKCEPCAWLLGLDICAIYNRDILRYKLKRTFSTTYITRSKHCTGKSVPQVLRSTRIETPANLLATEAVQFPENGNSC